ncbi:MAG: molybdate ABC transporter substrate-binding protein [Sphingomonadales bacterium]|nr:molybdate ABC transporter substrate-binding protein [Sphingomonadales bacterium]
MGGGVAAGVLAAAPLGAEARRPPVVLAAASLQEALTAVADSWAGSGHPRPILSFAASSALARQVEAGAPADLFLSADEDWMDALAQRGKLRAGTRADFAGNALVLVAPVARPQRLAVKPGFAIARALGSGRLAVGSVEAVPAGRYARQALVNLKVWPQVADRLAQGESVRAALALVARGEAPLGVVYATDALAEPKVVVAGRLPAASHEPIRYPVAVLAGSASPDAEGFRRYLLGPEGRAILRRFGFVAP